MAKSVHLSHEVKLLISGNNQNHSSLFCRWFKDYSEMDYARSGNEATSDVTIDAGTQKMWKTRIIFLN